MGVRSLWTLLLLVALCAGRSIRADVPSTGPATTQQVHATQFALGVYMPWETTLFITNDFRRMTRLRTFLGERLDDLAAHNVNLIWTNNGPDTPGELKLLCEMARARGIGVVVGSGHWLMHKGNSTPAFASDAVRAIERAWENLDKEVRPLAFVVADEPREAQVEQLKHVTTTLDDEGIPTATVVPWNRIELATASLPALRFLAGDIYPFFGSPHGPRGDRSYSFYITNAQKLVAHANEAGTTPWLMPQAFQEIMGPYTIENGHLVAQRGAGLHWLMPTPAQVRWQAWTAVASGAKGIVFFSYGLRTLPKPNAKPVDENWALTETTPTGAPGSLVSWPGYDPTPQYEALGETFAAIESIVPLLDGLNPITSELVVVSDPCPGDFVGHFADERGAVRYVLIVASPLRQSDHIGIRTKKGIALRDALQDRPMDANVLTIAPGTGALLRVGSD